MTEQATPDGGPSDAHRADVGIVCALNIEIAPLLERCERTRKYSSENLVFRGGRFDDIRIAIVEAGMGFSNARRATQALIDAHTPAWLISAGFAGGLQPDLQTGHLVLADRLVDQHGQSLAIDVRMPADESGGVHVGTLLTADNLVRTVAEKQALGEQYDALAVDLESLAIAQVCRDAKTRFLAVRVISDDLSADLPPEILSVYGDTGTQRIGAVVGAIWKRPSSIKDLWHLREKAMSAAQRLGGFLEGVIEQLYAADHQTG